MKEKTKRGGFHGYILKCPVHGWERKVRSNPTTIQFCGGCISILDVYNHKGEPVD
jgi:hypothetical protein